MSLYDDDEDPRDARIAELEAELEAARRPAEPRPKKAWEKALDDIDESDPNYVEKVMETVAKHGGGTTWIRQ